MKRQLIALISGTALAAVVTLAACSGGGSSSSPTPPSVSSTSNSGNSVQATANGLKMVLTINRSRPAAPAKKNVARRGAKSVRQPKYVSYAAEGLQIAVTATVAGQPVTKTIFADISESPQSPLCTQNSNYVQTCTLTIPTLAASETITATEVDTSPTSEGTNGNLPGYGSAFSTASNVLGAMTSTVSTTPGTTTAINFGIGPVLATMYDCDYAATVIPSTPTTYTAAFDDNLTPNRIVVSSGFAQTTVGYQYLYDIDDCDTYFAPPPAPQPSAVPLVDVNGSPEPWTYTSSSQHVLVALANPTATSTPAPSAFGTTASVTDTSLFANYDCILYALQIDSGFTAPATLTENNNLSATTLFTGHASPYTFTSTVNIVPVSVTPTSENVMVGGATPMVTGTDFYATSGMTAYGVVSSSGSVNGSTQNQCVDGSLDVDATITPGAAPTGTPWQQTFTITGTSPGTCTFYVVDADTNVVASATPITVVVTP